MTTQRSADEVTAYMVQAKALQAAEETILLNTGKGKRCIQGEATFYLPFDFALIPGHVYSPLGLKELDISGLCEFHFDKWTREETNGK